MAENPPGGGNGDYTGVTWLRLQAGLIRESVSISDSTSGSNDSMGSNTSMSTDNAAIMTSVKEAAYNFVAKKFPDQLFDGIRECLLLFVHEVSNPNILQLLTSSSQLSDGILVEVVLSSQVVIDDNNFSRPHSLTVHNYKSPHFCDLCGEMLWGLFKQGLKCDGCGLNFHKRCVYKIVNNCTRNRKQSLTLITDDGSATPSPAVQPVGISSASSSVKYSPSISSSPSFNRTTITSVTAVTPPIITRNIQVPHTFVAHNMTRPTVCQYCHKLLPLFRQSLQCKDCQFYCHKKCVECVPKNCQGETRMQHLMLGESDSAEDNEGTEGSDDSRDNAVVTESSEDSKADDENSDDQRESTCSINIPLMRVVQSVKHTKRASANVIREGWMVHYTNRDKTRKLHYWRLDTKSITLFTNKESTRYYKELQLSDILKLELCLLPQNVQRSHHVFEIHTQDTIFYSGEDCDPSLIAEDKGLGRQLAIWMESAIRQALLPVTPKQSNEVEESGNDLKVHVVEEEKKDINQLYHVFPDEILGSGQFGVVYGGIHRSTGREVAVKVIDKLRFPNKQESVLKNEVAILKNLHHPGVVNLEDMFDTSSKIFVVMEKLRGDMLEMILSSSKGRLNERITRYLTSQILKALQYLHARPRSIVHCDLKPENVLLSTGGSFPQVKLCDFGFARIIGEKSFRRSLVGTPAYLAPEVLKNKCYNRSLDMWSVGVIMYVSLSGTFPFNENEDIADQIQNAAFMYPPHPWKEVSHEAINLIGKLLQVKLGNRYNADQSLDHPWFQDYKCWCDLRMLESLVGERYLTYENEDHQWIKHQLDNRLRTWNEIGHRT